MCTAYHLAIIKGYLTDVGFKVVEGTRSRGQRLAFLPADSRAEIVQLDALIEAQHPEAAIGQCRSKAEGLFRDLYNLYFGADGSDKLSADAVLTKLDAHAFFRDQIVYSAAHWIRVIGNWVTHNSPKDLSSEDLTIKARECVDHLISILEWREKEAEIILKKDRPCRGCGRRISRISKNCPHCGANQLDQCPECKAALEQVFKFCPNCGFGLLPPKETAARRVSAPGKP